VVDANRWREGGDARCSDAGNVSESGATRSLERRALRVGDLLRLGAASTDGETCSLPLSAPRRGGNGTSLARPGLGSGLGSGGLQLGSAIGGPKCEGLEPGRMEERSGANLHFISAPPALIFDMTGHS